jgi:membrane-bound lytic murein transglycosylase B
MTLFTALLTATLSAAAAAATTAADFDACLASLQLKASEAGVEQKIVAEVIPTLQPQQQVLTLDRKQPEFAQTFGQYLTARATPARVKQGRELYARHREFLAELTQKTGVPGRYLLAFWGLETNFGSHLGGVPTLDALATLACDERRPTFFTNEFISALLLMQRDSLSPDQMRGSWAGAVGHTQFMPSSYLKYATDGDGDGQINLWRSERDALASGAVFLKELGWVPRLRWGREVWLADDFPYQETGVATKHSLLEWAKLGVRQADGQALPPIDIEGSIVVPAGHTGPAFLLYANFFVIMQWNRSESYAIAVGHLADRIQGAGRLRKPPSLEQAPLSIQQTIEMQRALNVVGYTAGEADGIFGPASRAALRAFQHAAGLLADGYPDQNSLARLQELESTH